MVTSSPALTGVVLYCSLLRPVFVFFFFLYLKGVTDVLCEACDQLGWTKPTKIQVEAIPLALQGTWMGTMSPATDPAWSSAHLNATFKAITYMFQREYNLPGFQAWACWPLKKLIVFRSC